MSEKFTYGLMKGALVILLIFAISNLGYKMAELFIRSEGKKSSKAEASNKF
jgi:hypothetical protein